MRRRFFKQEKVIPDNVILYTTNDGKVLSSSNSSTFASSDFVSNTYSNGQGELLYSDSITSIIVSMFDTCRHLKSIVIPKEVITIEKYAFYYCSGLVDVKIGEKVTSISDSAFSHCSSLTSFTIPNSVTLIGRDSLRYCDALTNIVVGDGMINIGHYAFANNDKLTSITIGNSVISMGNGVFYSCDILETVYCKAVTPPIIQSDTFKYVPTNCKIYVPRPAVSVYMAADYWKDFIIEGYDF